MHCLCTINGRDEKSKQVNVTFSKYRDGDHRVAQGLSSGFISDLLKKQVLIVCSAEGLQRSSIFLLQFDNFVMVFRKIHFNEMKLLSFDKK